MTLHRNFIDGKFVEPPTPSASRCSTRRATPHLRDSRHAAAMVGDAIAAAKRAQPGLGEDAADRARGVPAPDRGQDPRARRRDRPRHHRGAGQDPRPRARSRWRSPPTTSTTWPSGRAASRARSSPATGRARTSSCSASRSASIGGILPWNFPFFLIARKMAPALITGNTIVIKPSEETPNNAAMFAELVAQTGAAAGVFNIVYGRGATTGQALAGHPRHRHGQLHRQRRDRLEDHGGGGEEHHQGQPRARRQGAGDRRWPTPTSTSPSSAIRDSRVINSGQVCNCAERVYVRAKVAPTSSSRSSSRAMRETTLRRPARRRKPSTWARSSTGAASTRSKAWSTAPSRPAREVVTGGKVAEQRRRATTSSRRSSPTAARTWTSCSKEIFGPVLPVHLVDGLDEAIEQGQRLRSTA